MSLTNPRRISISQEELLLAIKKICIEKHKELEDEEFEIQLNYDSYNYQHSATIDVFD